VKFEEHKKAFIVRKKNIDLPSFDSKATTISSIYSHVDQKGVKKVVRML